MNVRGRRQNDGRQAPVIWTPCSYIHLDFENLQILHSDWPTAWNPRCSLVGGPFFHQKIKTGLSQQPVMRFCQSVAQNFRWCMFLTVALVSNPHRNQYIEPIHVRARAYHVVCNFENPSIAPNRQMRVAIWSVCHTEPKKIERNANGSLEFQIFQPIRNRHTCARTCADLT